jgi:hypothetical protein
VPVRSRYGLAHLPSGEFALLHSGGVIMFDLELFKKIVKMLTAYASDNHSTQQVADFIVLYMPMDWVIQLAIGVYNKNLSNLLGDTVLCSLDLVQKEIDIKGSAISHKNDDPRLNSYCCFRNGDIVHDKVDQSVVMNFLTENDPGDEFEVTKWMVVDDEVEQSLIISAIEKQSVGEW